MEFDDERQRQQDEIDAEVAASAAMMKAYGVSVAQDRRQHAVESRQGCLGRRDAVDDERERSLARREVGCEQRERALDERELDVRERLADQREIDAELATWSVGAGQ